MDSDQTLSELFQLLWQMYKTVQLSLQQVERCCPRGQFFMLERLGVPKERAYVFGDSSNDLSMFQFAQHAVAMEVHSSVLDPYAEYVTTKVEEDGIENALKHYGLI